MELSNIVDVVITRDSTTVSQQGFGTGMVLATHLKSTARLQYFDSLADLAVIHPEGSAPYEAAEKYFSQSPAPERIAVGRRQSDAANVQVASVQNNTLYRVTINGVNHDFTSDASATAAEIRDGLIAAINGGSEPVTASIASGDSLLITQDVSGTAWTLAISTNLAITALADSESISAALTAIENAESDWYGLVVAYRASVDQQAAAAWVEANKKLFFAATEEDDVVDVSDSSDTTSLAAILKAAGYERTAVIYHEDAAASYPDAALMGRTLALDPGTYTMKFKDLAGIPVSALTATQSQNARDKFCNTYEQVAGVNMVAEGQVSDGEFIDTIIGIDWLEARIAESVFAALAGSLKIPYTDAGVAAIVAKVKAPLQVGVDRGFLSNDPAPTVTAPRVADVPTVDKQNRLLPDVNFGATLAGAIHKTEIRGVVSV